MENNIFSFRTQNQNISPKNIESKKASIKKQPNNLKQAPKLNEKQQKLKKNCDEYDESSQMYANPSV